MTRASDGRFEGASARTPRGARELLLELVLRRGRLRQSVREGLREAIQDGRLQAGTSLPASRRLAVDLGVSRGVVSDVYDQLVSEGYLEASQDRGLLLGYGRLVEERIDEAVDALAVVLRRVGVPT